MTRVAPLLTMVAVASVGGALLVANTSTVPGSAPAAVTAALPPSDDGGGNGGGNGNGGRGGAGGQDDAPPPGRDRLALADVPVAGDRGEPPLGDVPPAPGAAPPPPAYGGGDAGGDGTYAGDTADGPDRPLTVAIAMADGRAVAYVCDNAGIEAWLRGSADGGQLDLVSPSGRTTLSGSPTDGVVTVDGVDYPYSAEPVDPDDAAAQGRPDVGDVAERLEGDR